MSGKRVQRKRPLRSPIANNKIQGIANDQWPVGQVMPLDQMAHAVSPKSNEHDVSPDYNTSCNMVGELGMPHSHLSDVEQYQVNAATREVARGCSHKRRSQQDGLQRMLQFENTDTSKG